MLKTTVGVIAATMLTAVIAAPAPARAEIEYPWCAFLVDGASGGVTNCGFVSYAQCMATLSGMGGYCHENPAYGPDRPRPKRSAKPRS